MKGNQRKEILKLTILNGCCCLLALFIHNRFIPLLILIIYSLRACTQEKTLMFRLSIWILKLHLISLGFEQHK